MDEPFELSFTENFPYHSIGFRPDSCAYVFNSLPKNKRKAGYTQVIHCCIHDANAFSTLNLYALLLYIMLNLTQTAFVSVFCTPLAKSDTVI